MEKQNANDLIRRYLQDVIAAEKNFETQMRAFSKEGEQNRVKALFAEHADETKNQWERLTHRLEALGGSTSGMKSVLAHVLGFMPKVAQLGHDEAERNTQDLLMAYAVENSEVGTYEVLATVASAAGDIETERLAREIQAEERATAQKVWNMLPVSARESFEKLTGGTVRTAGR